FLAKYALRLDFDRGRLTLLRSAGRDAGQPVPLKLERGTAWVEVKLLEESPPWRFLVNTGAIGTGSGLLGTDTFYSLEQVGKLRREGGTIAETAGGRVEGRQGRLQTLKLGPFEHRDLCFTAAPGSAVLSLSFWARYTATFDFPARVVYLQKSSRHDSVDA